MTVSRGLIFDKEQIFELYSDAKWTSYTNDKVALWNSIERSLEHFSIIENGKLIGYARVLGDGIHTILIQDLVIESKYQKKGIGSELIRTILEYYQEVRQIIVLSDNEEGLIKFYKNSGLRECDEYQCKCFIIIK
jgi:ribosomal protein S18 acetylase RimI-like enzyme